MITDIADYFSKGCGRCERFATADCSTRKWQEGLAALRRICLAAGLLPAVHVLGPGDLGALPVGQLTLPVGGFRRSHELV